MVDADIAVVLSWHMSADMDCIVTVTTKKVRRSPTYLSSSHLLFGHCCRIGTAVPDRVKPSFVIFDIQAL